MWPGVCRRGVGVVRKLQEEAHCARWIPETPDRTGPYRHCVFSYTYLPMMKSIN